MGGAGTSGERRPDVKATATLARLEPGTGVFLGIDLSKAFWNVTVHSHGATLAAFACPPRPESLLPVLAPLETCRVTSVYEAGPFGYGLHDWLVAHGVDSRVCSPAHVPVEVGNRLKTDRRDSLKLAMTLEAGLLRPIAIPTPQQRADRELVRQRERVVRRRRSAMAQIRGFLLTYSIVPPVGRPGPWNPSFVGWLSALELEDPILQASLDSLRRNFFEADHHLAEHTLLLRRLAQAPRHGGRVALLETAPGFGWLTALTFTVEIFDWCSGPPRFGGPVRPGSGPRSAGPEWGSQRKAIRRAVRGARECHSEILVSARERTSASLAADKLVGFDELRHALESDDGEMPAPGVVPNFDLEFDSRLASDENLRCGASGSTRPPGAGLETW